MRLFHLFILFSILFSSFSTVFTVGAQTSCIISSTLRVGSKGVEVECLQKKVGAIVDGNFGPMTKASVRAFQSKNGLVADGIVGPLSRLALNKFLGVAVVNVYPAGCTGALGYSPLTGVKCDGSASPSSSDSLTASPPTISNQKPELSKVGTNIIQNTNPNLVNLDQFIAKVLEVNKKNGSSAKELSLIADTLRKEIINSDINYKEKFKELLINESKLSADKVQSPFSVFDKILEKTFSFFGINPPVAHAQAGIPFGGALIYAFFCAYNDAWMIDVTPLPPSEVVLLTYFEGTQEFASYNIPFTEWLLGYYTPPGVCMIPGYPVIVIPTEGTILPMTGSSPL